VSIKSNIEYAGKELSGDEKMLESTLKLEAFYNKHKRLIWVAMAVVVAIFIINPIISMVDNMKLNSANEALLSLQKNNKDSEALKTLKSNNLALYELYIYSQAIKNSDIKALEGLSGSKNSLMADISSYHKNVLSSKSSESKSYRGMSMIEDAYIAIKAGERDKAREKLELIDSRSAVAPISDLLKHYTIKGE
jgi:hypothetical protein